MYRSNFYAVIFLVEITDINKKEKEKEKKKKKRYSKFMMKINHVRISKQLKKEYLFKYSP